VSGSIAASSRSWSRALREIAPRRDDRPPSGDRYRSDDDDDRHRRHPRRKRSFLESLGEIFD
jgi:hypothetical protein